MEGSEPKQSFFDRLKDSAGVVMDKTREGIGDLQTKQALFRAYNDLGRTTAELVEKGEVTHPQLDAAVEEIKKLKTELAAEEAEAEAPAPEPEPPAQSE